MVNAPCSIQTKRPQFVPGAFLRLRFPAECKPSPNEKSPRHTPWAFFSPWNLTCRINRNATPLRATLAVLRSIQE